MNLEDKLHKILFEDKKYGVTGKPIPATHALVKSLPMFAAQHGIDVKAWILVNMNDGIYTADGNVGALYTPIVNKINNKILNRMRQI